MADPTSRLNLQRYGAGDSNWSHTDTVNTLDELAIERGPIADRPVSGEHTDELYLATDQGIVWRWTGTEWTNSDRLNTEKWDWIDASSNGLPGDGSGSPADFIENNAADNTVLFFPPGTYSFDRGAVVEGVSGFSIMCPSGRAIFTEGTIGEGATMVTLGSFENPVSDIHVSGIQTDTVQARLFELYGGGLVEDILFTSEKGVSSVGATYHISCRVFDEGKTLTFKDVRMPEGGTYGEPLTDAAGGWFVHQETAGTVNFINCEASGFPNNGIYASAPGETGGEDGSIHIKGGTFIDNNVAGVRIGGDGSSVRDATFKFVAPDPDFSGVRGVYVRNGTGHVVENNRFETGTGVTGVSHIRVTSDAQSVALNNNYHFDEGGSRALRISDGAADSENRVTVDGLELRGDAGDEEYPIFIERDHTKLENISVIQPNRSAIWVTGNNCVLQNEDLTVLNNEFLDQGDRTLRNGRGTNAGDPNSGGAWSTNEAYAADKNAVVHDTTNNFLYMSMNGSFVQIN